VVPVSAELRRRGETGTVTAGDGGPARVAGGYAPSSGSASGSAAGLIGKRPPRNGDRGTTLRFARLRPCRSRCPGRLVVSKIQFAFVEAERAVEQHLDGAALGQNR